MWDAGDAYHRSVNHQSAAMHTLLQLYPSIIGGEEDPFGDNVGR